MKKFDIPAHYKSSIISQIKELRKNEDPRKKDFKPTRLDFGPVVFLIARHFGFCYGVENAIEIAYRTINENPGKRIFLLSEMIHNPHVNEDLNSRGIKFIMDNYGKQFIPWNEINSDDIVIIPAFGTTIEIENLLKEKGIDTVKYNTTCPFVEKVWNRAESIGKEDYTIIIHGKHKHEETRATFSHSTLNSPSVIVRDIEETRFLCKIISGEFPTDRFYQFFRGKYSNEFNVEKDLIKVGVVNQTTMLASETEAIADLIRQTMIEKFGLGNIKKHFADTRDTLCYATNDNQSATLGLMNEKADLAIVVGGYNSSNTSHLVELLEDKFPTYFVSEADKIISDSRILHYDLSTHSERITENFLPLNRPVVIAVTSGASCPDSIVDDVLNKLIGFFENSADVKEVLRSLQ
ncbi:MAG TPA: 4-hydroxy-3-methylbut-2-enyl diphosphate reductase [Melioribacteraceae bacterium]|nr:4-hydroxy-3-methylbut-2-enyl diphosphate reductase [Melioribacteraceae bacterium]